MDEREMLFLPLKIEPEEGDRLIAAPCWLLPANMAERGIFTRMRVKRVTALVDASRGAAEVVDGEVAPVRRRVACDVKILPAKLSRADAEEAASSLSSVSPRGWRRGIRSAELFFLYDVDEPLVYRLYIVRGPLLADSFTGESSEAASLLDFLI